MSSEAVWSSQSRCRPVVSITDRPGPGPGLWVRVPGVSEQVQWHHRVMSLVTRTKSTSITSHSSTPPLSQRFPNIALIITPKKEDKIHRLHIFSASTHLIYSSIRWTLASHFFWLFFILGGTTTASERWSSAEWQQDFFTDKRALKDVFHSPFTCSKYHIFDMYGNILLPYILLPLFIHPELSGKALCD